MARSPCRSARASSGRVGVGGAPVHRLVGHGKSSCVSAVGLGVNCVLQGIFSLKEGMRVARIFTLADLANPADHKFMIMTGKAFTMVMTLNDRGSFEAVSSLFELKEPTLNMGVMNGHYVQITPTKVLGAHRLGGARVVVAGGATAASCTATWARSSCC